MAYGHRISPFSPMQNQKTETPIHDLDYLNYVIDMNAMSDDGINRLTDDEIDELARIDASRHGTPHEL